MRTTGLAEHSWWQTRQPREALVERLLGLFIDPAAGRTRDKTRRRGLAKLLAWLQRQPGDTWQDRWLASGADTAGFGWADLPLRGRAPARRHHRDELCCGLELLVAGQVIRPGYAWLLRQRQALMLAEARAAIDPHGFQRLEPYAEHAAGWARSDALNKLTWIVIRKGGLVGDITVGDCVELTATLQEHHFRGSAGRPLFYAMLKKAGVLPATAPERLRVLRLDGRRSVEQIVDGYGIQCRAIRDLLVEYLTERSPDLDHTSLRSNARNLCRLFWRDLEIHHPGIDSLRLPPEVAQAWKERLAHIRDADGRPVRPRVNYRSELVYVRAFYEDIARWAADDPARWAPWVAPCPIKATEVTRKKFQSRVKARWTSGPAPNCRCYRRCCGPSSRTAPTPRNVSTPPPPPLTEGGSSPVVGNCSAVARVRPVGSTPSTWARLNGGTLPTRSQRHFGRGRRWKCCGTPGSASRRCWS